MSRIEWLLYRNALADYLFSDEGNSHTHAEKMRLYGELQRVDDYIKYDLSIQLTTE